MSGERSQRLRLETLIARLDTPLEAGGDRQVRYLRYADPEKLATKLRKTIQASFHQLAGSDSMAREPRSPSRQHSINRSMTMSPIRGEHVRGRRPHPRVVLRSVIAIMDRLDVTAPRCCSRASSSSSR